MTNIVLVAFAALSPLIYHQTKEGIIGPVKVEILDQVDGEKAKVKPTAEQVARYRLDILDHEAGYMPGGGRIDDHGPGPDGGIVVPFNPHQLNRIREIQGQMRRAHRRGGSGA